MRFLELLRARALGILVVVILTFAFAALGFAAVTLMMLGFPYQGILMIAGALAGYVAIVHKFLTVTEGPLFRPNHWVQVVLGQSPSFGRINAIWDWLAENDVRGIALNEHDYVMSSHDPYVLEGLLNLRIDGSLDYSYAVVFVGFVHHSDMVKFRLVA